MKPEVFALAGDQAEKVAKIVVKPDKTIGTDLTPCFIVMPEVPINNQAVSVLDCHHEAIGTITMPQAFSLQRFGAGPSATRGERIFCMTEEALEEGNRLVISIKQKEGDLAKAKEGCRVYRMTPGGGVDYLYHIRPEVLETVQTIVVASLEKDIAAMKARLAEL